MKSKIGFFGGCFNPVTNAHLNLIRDVIESENLEKVYFVPMGEFYKKEGLLPFSVRAEMLKIAFEKEDKMDILEVSNTNNKMCAIDTFKIIDKMFPDVERFFIMGSDNYKKLSTWKNSEELIKKYKYIVLDRENGDLKDISSTLIRQKIKNNERIEELLPAQVIKYIEQKKLYK